MTYFDDDLVGRLGTMDERTTISFFRTYLVLTTFSGMTKGIKSGFRQSFSPVPFASFFHETSLTFRYLMSKSQGRPQQKGVEALIMPGYGPEMIHLEYSCCPKATFLSL